MSTMGNDGAKSIVNGIAKVSDAFSVLSRLEINENNHLTIDGVEQLNEAVTTGDMLKSTYDTNSDDIVDKSEDANKLGGNEPSYYAKATDVPVLTNKATLDKLSDDGTNLTFNGTSLTPSNKTTLDKLADDGTSLTFNGTAVAQTPSNKTTLDKLADDGTNLTFNGTSLTPTNKTTLDKLSDDGTNLKFNGLPIIGNSSGSGNGIEILNADPTGADLWEGRMWIITSDTSDTTAPIITASSSGGTFTSTQTVTLSSNETGTIIYYTLDGTTPTTASSVYSSALNISSTSTLKFFGKDAAGNQSTVQSISFTINAPDTTAPTVTISPTAGTFTSAQSVTLTANEPATIFYTLDGTTPTTSSNVYSSPINISSTSTINYFAKDTAGNQSSIQSAIFTINLADTTAPNSVTNLTVGTPTSSSIPVTWTLSTSNDVANYEVAYSTDSVNYMVSSNVVNASSTSYTVTGLSASTNYTIRLVAIDTSNNRSTGVTVSANTAAYIDTTPPNNVTNLTANNIAYTSLTLNWSASTSSDVASYDVYKGATLLGNTSSTTYNVTLLNQSTTYSFTVKAKDNSGNVASGTTINNISTLSDTTPPNEVATVNVVTITEKCATVMWSPSTSSDIDHYLIVCNGVTTPVYSNSGYIINLSFDTTYNGLIRSVDTLGNISAGKSFSFTTLPENATFLYYNFDEASGATVGDSSWNGYNATATGTTIVPGLIVSRARKASSIADYIKVPSIASMSGFTKFNISMYFVRNTASTGYQALASYYVDSTGAGLGWYITYNDTALFGMNARLKTSAGDSTALQTNYYPPLGQLHKLTFNWDGTNAVFTVYTVDSNGTLTQVATVTKPIGGSIVSNINPITILCANSTVPSQSAPFTIDEFLITTN